MDVIPREFTAEEMRERLFRQIAGAAAYWAAVKPSIPSPGCKPQEMTVQYRLNGLVHSIFAVLEGRTLGVPSFDLIPAPHESDKDFYINEGKNWWEPIDINDGGSLTGQWHRFQPPE